MPEEKMATDKVKIKKKCHPIFKFPPFEKLKNLIQAIDSQTGG